MPRASKRKQTANAVNQLVAALKQATVAGPSVPKKTRKRKPRRRVANTSIGTLGEVQLSRRELVDTIKLGANSGTASGAINLRPDAFHFLKGIAKSFDRFKWLKMNFFYKPAVGTTYGGLISIGIDWDSAAGVQSRADISSLTPNRSFAAWNDTERSSLVLPPQRLQSRMWYVPHRETADDIDRQPGILKWAADGESSANGKTLGEIWVEYSVMMAGTNAS